MTKLIPFEKKRKLTDLNARDEIVRSELNTPTNLKNDQNILNSITGKLSPALVKFRTFKSNKKTKVQW